MPFHHDRYSEISLVDQEMKIMKTASHVHLRSMVRCSIMITTLSVIALIMHLSATVTYSAPLQQTTTLEAKINQVIQQLTALGRPIAAISLVIVLIAWLAEPILPEFARENRGAIAKIFIAAALLGIAPDLVNFFFS
jgi:hypothetical protein